MLIPFLNVNFFFFFFFEEWTYNSLLCINTSYIFGLATSRNYCWFVIICLLFVSFNIIYLLFCLCNSYCCFQSKHMQCLFRSWMLIVLKKNERIIPGNNYFILECYFFLKNNRRSFRLEQTKKWCYIWLLKNVPQYVKEAFLTLFSIP